MTAPAPLPASAQQLAIDNLIRRELKVGNPKDAQQVALALAERYQASVRAQAITGEARGLPFLHTPIVRAPEAQAPVATDVDLHQARDDVDQDLKQLVSDNLAKDIRPELEGWQVVIHRSIDEGVAAARQGLDPHRRDTAFAMRRQLGEYARLARLVGTMSPALGRTFRNLATSLDEVSSVILVLMGESMANLGFSGGRFLLQAPYTELQARRDAVLNALRAVDGVAAMSGSDGGWPRGLRAYRQLNNVLEAQGHGDLRSLMNEAELARTLDELVQQASGSTPYGLRTVGATAWGPLNRLNRLVRTTSRQVAPASPQLATLNEALQLFIDSFVPAGGFRLLRVARPAVLNYGLYGPARANGAENRLAELVGRRGALARELDCMSEHVRTQAAAQAMIVLDTLLHAVDRAIELYCVGDIDLGLPEARAASYSYLIDQVIAPANPIPPFLQPAVVPAPVSAELTAIRDLLRPTGAAPRHWGVATAAFDHMVAQNFEWLAPTPVPLRIAQVMHDELHLQGNADLQWRPVVEQMSSGCIAADDVFAAQTGCLLLPVQRSVDRLVALTAGAPGGPVFAQVEDMALPPHHEESLQEIVAQI